MKLYIYYIKLKFVFHFKNLQYFHLWTKSVQCDHDRYKSNL